MGKEKRQSPSTLLWFIRHKSYVPISEIRRRFSVDSEEGTFIDADNQRRVFVGLPGSAAQSLQKLYQQGKIGLEYSVEFDADVIIGVYPMIPSKEDMNGNGYISHRREPPRDRASVDRAQPQDVAVSASSGEELPVAEGQ
jgi:hypothetical protein